MLCRLATINPVLYDDIEDRVCWHRRTPHLLFAHAMKCRKLWSWEPRLNTVLRVKRTKRCFDGSTIARIEAIKVYRWVSYISIKENGYFQMLITPFLGVTEHLYHLTVSVLTTGEWKLTKRLSDINYRDSKGAIIKQIEGKSSAPEELFAELQPVYGFLPPPSPGDLHLRLLGMVVRYLL